MKKIVIFSLVSLFFLTLLSFQPKKQKLPIIGTWRLISATVTENNKATVTDYTKNKELIKIINETHFAFLSHDLTKGQDAAAFFSAGGGTYSLVNNIYTENLEFCNDRKWERNSFSFVITINNDTLIQKGEEKVPGTNSNRINMEKYVRVSRP